METYTKDLEVFDADTKKLEKEALFEINNDKELQICTETLVKVSATRKSIDAKRKEFVKPLNDHVKKINNEFKMRLEPVQETEKKLKIAIGNYQMKKEEEAKALAAAQEAKGEMSMIEAPKTTLRSTDGAVSVKKVWKFEVTDETKVPKKYLIVDEVALRKDIVAGEREISGVKIYQENQLSVR